MKLAFRIKHGLAGFLFALAIASPAFCAPLQVDMLLGGLRDTAGNSLSSGKVYTYAAGTTAAQACWYDSAGQNQAANPVILNAAGMAQIYCQGTYKFVIEDQYGTNLYTFDNLTYNTLQTSSWTVVPASITYVSGTQFTISGNYASSFPANIAIQVTIVSGPITGWVTSSDYGVTNGGKTTVNVSWSSGSMTSYVTGSEASVGPSPATLPPPEVAGTIKPFNGFIAPTGYFLCDGTAYSRATYQALFQISTISTTGAFTAASATVTGIASSSQGTGTSFMSAGMPISGAKIPAGTTILSVDSGTQITMSQGASASGGGVAFVVAPNGVGDGVATFNVPDLRGRMIIGTGTGAGLTARVFGQIYGSETHTQSLAEMPTHNHPGTTATSTDSGHTHYTGITSNASPYDYGVFSPALATGSNSRGGITTATGYANVTTTVTVAAQGSGSAMNILNPVWAGNYIVKY